MESGIWWRSQLLASGVGESELRRRVRDGSVVALRRGAYTDGLPERAEERHALQVYATAPLLAPDAVVSHASAAVLHGIDLWDVPLDRVHVTRARRSGARIGPEVHVHAAPLGEHEVVPVRGLWVTSPARTVVDLARSLPFEHGVVVADSALARSRVTKAELAQAADVRRPGIALARRTLAFADAGGASPGESRSRVSIARAGLPPPVLQRPVHCRRTGRLLGIADFWWEDVVGEFDGRVKYGRLARPGEDPADVVWREKRREDAMRAEVRAMVRWAWEDLADFGPTAARLRGLLQ